MPSNFQCNTIFRFKLLTPLESRGIGIFVGNFALPALIFGALSTIQLHSVNWNFVLSILITKSVLFVGVLLVTISINRGQSIDKAGLYSIFVTQTNDFALGYPIVIALYGASHPEFPAYLYLLAPISLAILNPIAFILMEIGIKIKNMSIVTQTSNQCSGTDNICHVREGNRDVDTVKASGDRTLEKERVSNTYEKLKTVLIVVLGIIKNPILVMTFAGILFGTFVFKGDVPPAINNFLTTLGRAFSATALFSLGLGMVGKMKTLTSGSKKLVTEERKTLARKTHL